MHSKDTKVHPHIQPLLQHNLVVDPEVQLLAIQPQFLAKNPYPYTIFILRHKENVKRKIFQSCRRVFSPDLCQLSSPINDDSSSPQNLSPTSLKRTEGPIWPEWPNKTKEANNSRKPKKKMKVNKSKTKKQVGYEAKPNN